MFIIYIEPTNNRGNHYNMKKYHIFQSLIFFSLILFSIISIVDSNQNTGQNIKPSSIQLPNDNFPYNWNNDDSLFPDITIDSLGILHVVWSDDTNGLWGNDTEIGGLLQCSRRSIPGRAGLHQCGHQHVFCGSHWCCCCGYECRWIDPDPSHEKGGI